MARFFFDDDYIHAPAEVAFDILAKYENAILVDGDAPRASEAKFRIIHIIRAGAGRAFGHAAPAAVVVARRPSS